MLVSWLVHKYHRFGGTYRLHLHPWRWRQYVPPNVGIYLPVHTASQPRRVASLDVTTPRVKPQYHKLGLNWLRIGYNG
jgi:hypothetical protein